MIGPKIRPVKFTDIPAITRIYAHAVEHGTATFELEPPDETEMARRMNELTSRNFPYLVAEYDSALAGYAYAGPYRARPAYRFTVESSVYVAPDRHRRGVGKALLEELIEASTERGFRLMIALISDSKQPASLRLHLAIAFIHVVVLENIAFECERWHDNVLMQRALGPGASSPP